MAITTSSSGQVISNAKAVRASADTILVFVERRQEGYVEGQPGRRTYEAYTKKFVVLVPVRRHVSVDAAIEKVLLGQSTYPTVYELSDPKRYTAFEQLAGSVEHAHEHKVLENSRCLGVYKIGETSVEVHVGQLHGLWYTKEVAADHDDNSTGEAFETEEEAIRVAKEYLVKCGSES